MLLVSVSVHQETQLQVSANQVVDANLNIGVLANRRGFPLELGLAIDHARAGERVNCDSTIGVTIKD